jgi:hypothetical protein
MEMERLFIALQSKKDAQVASHVTSHALAGMTKLCRIWMPWTTLTPAISIVKQSVTLRGIPRTDYLSER